MKDNKKIIVLLGITIIIAIIIIVVLVNNKKENESVSAKPTVSDFLSVFELENMNSSKYKTEKAKDIKVAEKYTANRNAYRLEADVEFGERTGEIIYIRDGSTKANVFQTKYRIDELGSISSQVENYIEIFKNQVISYIGVLEDEKGFSESISGTDINKIKLPLGESIYNEKRLYSITYKDTENEGRKYDINFYRNEIYLVCEFVKVF